MFKDVHLSKGMCERNLVTAVKQLKEQLEDNEVTLSQDRIFLLRSLLQYCDEYKEISDHYLAINLHHVYGELKFAILKKKNINKQFDRWVEMALALARGITVHINKNRELLCGEYYMIHAQNLIIQAKVEKHIADVVLFSEIKLIDMHKEVIRKIETIGIKKKDITHIVKL